MHLSERAAAAADEPAANGTYAVDELVAALRDDPVIVSQIMGNGQTAQVDAALTQLAAEVDYPVYIALVNTPPGLAITSPEQELTGLLHARIGEDGLYVVGVYPASGRVHVDGFGDGVPSWSDIYRSNPSPPGYAESAPQQSVAGDVAEVVATAAADLRLPSSDLEQYRSGDLWAQPGTVEAVDPPTDGTYAVVATSLGVGPALVAFFLLRAAAGGASSHHPGHGQRHRHLDRPRAGGVAGGVRRHAGRRPRHRPGDHGRTRQVRGLRRGHRRRRPKVLRY